MAQLRVRWLHFLIRSPIVIGSSLLIALVVACTVLVHFVEGWGWIDAVYFSVVSVTTVGYGDLQPKSDVTKLFLVLYLPAGIGVGFAVLTSLGTRLIESQRQRLVRRHGRMAEHDEEEGQAR